MSWRAWPEDRLAIRSSSRELLLLGLLEPLGLVLQVAAAVLERALAAGQLVRAGVDRLLLGQQALLDAGDLRAALAQLGLEVVARRARRRGDRPGAVSGRAGQAPRSPPAQRPSARGPLSRRRCPGRPRPGRWRWATSRRLVRATSPATTPATRAEAPIAPAKVPAHSPELPQPRNPSLGVSLPARLAAGPLLVAMKRSRLVAARHQIALQSIGAPGRRAGDPAMDALLSPFVLVHSDRSSSGAVRGSAVLIGDPGIEKSQFAGNSSRDGHRPLAPRLNRGQRRPQGEGGGLRLRASCTSDSGP